MDHLSSPRLARRARYESFPPPPHFPDPNYSPQRHPPFSSLAPHPAAPTPSAIPRNRYYEPQLVHTPGDLSYFPSPHRSNHPGFDLRPLPFPRVSDRAIHRGPPDGKQLLPELWERDRGGVGSVDKYGVFDEGPDRFQSYDNFFKSGDPDRALIARRRLESEQDRLSGDDYEWNNQRRLKSWDERERSYHDPFLTQLPPEAAPLVTALPPFHSPRGLRSAGLVKNNGGESSSVFVHRHPPSTPLSSGRSFSDPKVVKSAGAMSANSQFIGNGPGPRRVHSGCKKKNNARDVLPDRGFGGRQHMGHKPIKKSYPTNVANEDGFWSSYHMVRKESSISSMNKEHEFEEDYDTGHNAKKNLVSIRGAKYNANLAKRPMQKPSAFSRIQSGLSVWERLEEKPLILPPPCSPPCSLSSPKTSNEADAKANILDLSFKSNTPVAKDLNPFSAEPSSIKNGLLVDKLKRLMKKNMTQTRDKVISPIVSSLSGSSEKRNRVKKKRKKMIQTREKVVISIVSSSPGSIAKQGVRINSNASSLGSVSVPPEANKSEVSSCMPGIKSMTNVWAKKVNKLAVDMKSGAKEAAKIISQVDGCIIETPKMEDGMESPMYEGVINCAKEISNCTYNVDTETEPIDDSHLQICQKILMMQATPTNNDSANIITKDINQAQDSVIEILDDSGEESLELGKKLDSICRSSLDFDVNVCSQPSECIIDCIAIQDSFINMDENDAANSVKQIKSVNSSPWKIEQDMPPPDNAVSPELLGVGEVIVSAGSRTAYSDNTLNCTSAEIEIEREVKHREKMVFITATEEVEIPGNYASAESCIHGLHAPSFPEISNSAPEYKLHCEGTVKENNMLPQSVCNMTILDSLDARMIDSCGKKMGKALLLGSMEMDSPDIHFENLSHSHPEASENMDFNNNIHSGNGEPSESTNFSHNAHSGNGGPSESMNFNNNAHSGNGNPEHGDKGEAFVSSMVPCASEPGHESAKTAKNCQLMLEKAQLLPSHELKKQVPTNPKLTDEELSCKKTLSLADIPRFPPSRQDFSVSLKEAARASQTGRHRTWLRSNTPSLHSDENLKLGGTLSKQVPKKLGKIQNSSYFRKGNSLIRKLAAEPPVLIPTVGSSSRKFKSITESSLREIRSECPDNPIASYPLFERPKTPPLPPLPKLSGFPMDSRKDFSQLIPMDRSPEPDTDQVNQHDSQSTDLFACNLDGGQDTASCKTVEIINAKRVIYIKRKMNQLVAASGPEILTEQFQKPVHHPIEKSKSVPFSSSYLYYRSKRNQLIRNATSSDSKLTEIPAGNTNSVDSLTQGNNLPYKKRLDNVLQKAKKPTKSSLVWTLGGDKLSQKCIATFGCQRVFPYIFPWKRAVNWKSFMTPTSIPISSRSSLSLISRKLQCLRKRDTIYKVSTNGFSLRKAGVVSIGGSSLKWSKSIEKRSKKASEEATLAVAEVERKKRERKRSKSTCGNGKNKVSLTCRSTSGIELKRGERIFRVGSARYKMDASMRTLLRIPDDLSSSSANEQPGNSSRISFIPRRLIIGNNEYVRIGNGNQLVRDPKKLKRILANEKVRWSLHSARLRLAQKRQYCLFFTRFGKCNKSGRKCPYIHDPTKVAICTKFLKGQCSGTNCKLTHKVIPERMPDCSYFLKGLCTNLNCPYRHVKVNANAPLCDGFLRGHCADGDECRKKHSYTCPLFEATGKCPQGFLCKLHHPKNHSKSRKRKRNKIQSRSLGRYFYSSVGKDGETLGVPFCRNDLEGGNDIFCSDGRFTEYIELDVDGDDVAINNDESYMGMLDSGYLDLQSCDIDAHIKPVRIMNKDDLTIF